MFFSIFFLPFELVVLKKNRDRLFGLKENLRENETMKF